MNKIVWALSLGLTLFGCQRGDEERLFASRTPAASTIVESATKPQCESVDYNESIDLPEASGATFMEGVGLVVVGDSGRKGVYNILDEQGQVIEEGFLPIDESISDDLEGLSVHNDTLVALTSAGWIQHFQRKDKGFVRVDGPYPIGSKSSKLVCRKNTRSNCGKNYEGLCLSRRARGKSECAGFALSKHEGALYCLERGDDGRYLVDRSRHHIKIAGKGELSGCDFSYTDESVWITSNLLGGLLTYRVNLATDGHETIIEPIARQGGPFPEAIAMMPKGEIVYFSDTKGTPSLVSQVICK